MAALGGCSAIIGGSWDIFVSDKDRQHFNTLICERCIRFTDMKTTRSSLTRMLVATKHTADSMADGLSFFLMGMSAIQLRLFLREWCIQASRTKLSRVDQAHTWHGSYARNTLIDLLLEVMGDERVEAAFLFLNTLRITLNPFHMSRCSPWSILQPGLAINAEPKAKKKRKGKPRVVVNANTVIETAPVIMEDEEDPGAGARMSKEEMRELGLASSSDEEEEDDDMEATMD